MNIKSDFLIENGILKKYVGTGSNIEIPEGVTKIEWGAFKARQMLTDITIPEGVTIISGEAFEDCKELSHVKLPDSLTEIGYHAFKGCDSLDTIKIPRGVKKIGEEAFLGTALYRASSNWKKGLFYIDDVLLKSKQSLKGDCTIRSGTRLIGDKAFAYCEGLTDITIPEGLEIIGNNAFVGCSSMKTITLPGSLTNIGDGAFSGSGCITMTIPGSVKEIGTDAFGSCNDLEEICFSEGVKGLGNKLFSYCKKLRRLNLPSSLSSLSAEAFYGCESLTEINIAEGNSMLSSIEGVVFRNNGTELLLAPRGLQGKYSIPDGVTSIAEKAFAGCTRLTDVEIPDSVISIGEYAFSSCNRLREIVVPGGVKNISKSTFQHCNTMVKAELLEGVEEIGQFAFLDCYSLTTIRIPASLERINQKSFQGCKALANFELAPESETYQIQNDALLSRDGTRLYFCPATLTGEYIIPEGVRQIDETAFYNCRELDGVVVPQGINKIDGNPFLYCPKLTGCTVYDDYPDGIIPIGALFGYIEGRYQKPRTDCTITVKSVQSGETCYKVRLSDESPSVNGTLRRGAWGRKATFNFRKIDEIFSDYKDINNRLLTAYYRLEYPIDLDEKTAEKYRSFIKRNGYKILPHLVAARDTETVRAFLELGAVGKNGIDDLIEASTNIKNAEMTAILINYKQMTFGNSEIALSLSEKADVNWAFKKENPELLWRYTGTDSEPFFPTEFNGSTIIGIADTAAKKPENYEKIERLIIPEGYTSIGKNAFSGCVRLKEVILPRTLYSIGENAFSGCLSLKEIVLPSSVISLGTGCFANCQALEKVELPETLRQIPDRAFFQCIKLKKIDLPRGLLSVGDEAFRCCQALREIDLGEDFIRLGNKSFYLTKLETVIFRGKKCSASSGVCFEYPRYVFTDGEIDALGIPRATWMPLSYLGLKNEELADAAGGKLLDGLTVYGLGTLKAFPKLDDYRYSNMTFADFITRLGGSYSKTLNKTVDLMVTFAVDPENATICRAQKQGIAIVEEEEFLKTIQKKERPKLDKLCSKSTAFGSYIEQYKKENNIPFSEE